MKARRPGPNKTRPKTMAVRVKHIEALELRIAGHNLQAIADKLGYSDPKSAWKAIEAAIAERVSPLAEQHREIVQARIDAAIQVVMPKVQAGKLEAIDRLIKLIDKECKLHGLYMPLTIQGPRGETPILQIRQQLTQVFASLSSEHLDALAAIQEAVGQNGEVIDAVGG